MKKKELITKNFQNSDPVLELSAPLMVDFEITNRCSYKCFFCEGDTPNITDHTELSTADCYKIFDKLSVAGVLSVFLTGGDPLMREDLPDLISYCIIVGLEPCVSTNLLNFDETKLDKLLKAGLDRLQVSIQGPKIIHEKIVGNPNTYSLVMKNLAILKGSGIKIEVVCVGLKREFKIHS